MSVDGQTVTFAIIGDSATFTYTVRAPDVAAEYSFAGIVTSSNDVDGAVGGDSSVTVEAEEVELPKDPELRAPAHWRCDDPGLAHRGLGCDGSVHALGWSDIGISGMASRPPREG